MNHFQTIIHSWDWELKFFFYTFYPLNPFIKEISILPTENDKFRQKIQLILNVHTKWHPKSSGVKKMYLSAEPYPYDHFGPTREGPIVSGWFATQYLENGSDVFYDFLHEGRGAYLGRHDKPDFGPKLSFPPWGFSPKIHPVSVTCPSQGLVW